MAQQLPSLVPLSTYVRELRPHLPAEVFLPSRSRLALVPVHLAVITAATLAIALGWVPWPVMLALSVLIGLTFAGLTFIAHEAMHGGITRSRRLKHVTAWIGFAPFVISPRLWAAWHDRVHHSCANNSAEDPDVYPTLDEYRTNSRVRFFINWFALGGRRWRGGLSLVLGFTVQALHMLITARRRGFLDRRGHLLAIGETLLGVAVWATVAALVGFVPFLLVFVAPLLIANAVVMGFILTNHSLSPNAAINDPLVTGLSVTNARWIERATLLFGYHVEHHLFPAMSSRHAPKVRALLRSRWPDRYQSMPLRHALLRLHRTSRVYKDATTLVDPRTGAEFATLGTAPSPS
jgi:fatty acid desaturase